MASVPLFRSGLVLLIAIGAVYLGNVVWESDDLADNEKQGSKDGIPVHYQNKYVPKDENGDFIDMTSAEANLTFWRIVHATHPNLFAEFFEHVGSADGDKKKDLGRIVAVGELHDTLQYLLDKMSGGVEQKNELISEFELVPLAESLESIQNHTFEEGSRPNAMDQGVLKNYEKEKHAVDQVLDVLVMKDQRLAFQKLKLLFETVKVTDLNPQILPNLFSLVCLYNTAKIVKLFIGQGFPFNDYYKGLTPHHWAVLNKNNEALEISQVLLENGANCNLMTADEQQLVPLQLSVVARGKDFAAQLLSLYLQYNPSCTRPTDVLDKSYFKSSFKNQKVSGDDLHKSILTAAMFGTLDGVKYLLEEAGDEEINVNSFTCGEDCSWKSVTLIHIIFNTELNKTRAFEKIKFLLEEKGAALHPTLDLDTTYLHLASQFGTAEVVEYFLNKGLDVNARETTDKTPLVASLGNKDDEEGLKIGKILLENGAQCEKFIGQSLTEENLKKLKNKLDFLYETYKPACL